MEKIKILIADDHAIVREGLVALLKFEPDFEVLGLAVDGVEAVEKASQLSPDVILMDLVMPNMDGIAAIQEIHQANPQVAILVLTSFAEDDQVFAAIKAGALGYLLKDAATPEIFEAIRCVKRGESSLHPSVAKKLLLRYRTASSPPPLAETLTSREVQVAQLVAKGFTNHEIGQQLFVGEATIRFHVSNILRKLALENRTQLVLFALREKLAVLPRQG